MYQNQQKSATGCHDSPAVPEAVPIRMTMLHLCAWFRLLLCFKQALQSLLVAAQLLNYSFLALHLLCQGVSFGLEGFNQALLPLTKSPAAGPHCINTKMTSGIPGHELAELCKDQLAKAAAVYGAIIGHTPELARSMPIQFDITCVMTCHG